MTRSVRHPVVRLALLVLVLVVSTGAVRAVYVGPREREAAELKARYGSLAAKVDDLQRGIGDLAAWSNAHPAERAEATRGRQAPPARELVPAFLKALEPIAARHGIVTETIDPVGPPAEETVPGLSGRPVRLLRQSLRFRLRGAYRDIAEYVREVDGMSAFVMARTVALRYDGTGYPALQAEVRFDLYGAP
ncbi:MAG TPA: hypothetical protein VFX78_06750 [Candidatus Eisenbacteria bacterium]|jgi:hypothetical protein|nr:hypothetical protein [Candidatus Eisenbacteria bacterium]